MAARKALSSIVDDKFQEAEAEDPTKSKHSGGKEKSVRDDGVLGAQLRLALGAMDRTFTPHLVKMS